MAAFKDFTVEVANACLQRDSDQRYALIAELMKLIGNSSYGRTITDKMKHCDLCFADEHQIGTEIMDPNFYNLSELKPGFYEVEKTKKELLLDLPVHIGVFILNYAKLRMLQFYYDFINKYLNQSLYEINETDTNSLYMSLAGNSVEELVPQEKKQAFKAEKHLWFVTSQAPQGKRTPGLFKVEYTGTKMVSLCSKSHCFEDTDNGTVKFSMKRVNKNQFDNPMTHYQETL